jgi:superfamily II DNA helicase RecQ
MKRREVFIDVQFAHTNMASFKVALKEILVQPGKNAILYKNFRTSLISHYEELRSYFDENKFHEHDIVMVHGEMSNLEKFYNINVFTGKDKIRIATIAYELFSPRLLLATKAANAGIDDPDIFLVFHLGLLDNLCNGIQEMGRAHRRESTTTGPHTDRFMVQFHLADFVGMLKQIERTKKSRGILKTNQAKHYAKEELLEVMLELVLPTNCFHQRFEWMMSNPFERVSFANYVMASLPCENACSFCTKTHTVRKLKRALFTTFMIDLFINHSARSLQLPNDLPKKMSEIENGTWQCFHKGKKGSMMQQSDAKIVVMQMLSSGILIAEVEHREKGDMILITTSLGRHNGKLNILIDSFWTRIQCI